MLNKKIEPNVNFNVPKTKVAPTPKPRPSKTPFKAPTLKEYKTSAAYRVGEMTYKEYVEIAEQVYKSKKKKNRKG